MLKQEHIKAAGDGEKRTGLCGCTANESMGVWCTCAQTALVYSPALMKSCEAVTLDVRGYRSLNCYHTALTPLATGYIPPKLILACTRNNPPGPNVYVLLLMFMSQLHMCFLFLWICIYAEDTFPAAFYTLKIGIQMLQFHFALLLDLLSSAFHLPGLFNLTLNERYSITFPSPHLFRLLSFSWEHPIIVLDWRKICGLYLPSSRSF